MLGFVGRVRETFIRSPRSSPPAVSPEEAAAEAAARVAAHRSSLAAAASTAPPPPTLLETAARVAAAHFDSLPAEDLAALPPDLSEILLQALAARGALTTARLGTLLGVGVDEDGDCTMNGVEDGAFSPPPAGAQQPLAALHLPATPGLCDAWLALVPPGRLASVDVSGCGHRGVTDAGLAALARAHGATLTRLAAGGARRVSCEGVAAVAAACPNLRALALDGCDGLGKVGVRAIGARLTGLTSLSVRACAGAGCGLGAALAGLPALASLDAGWCSHAGDVDACALAAAPRPASGGLTALSLAHTVVSDKGVAALTGSPHTAPRLRSLNLAGCASLTGRGVEAIAAGLTALTFLDLSSSGRANPAGARRGGGSGSPPDAAYASLGALPALADLRLALTDAGDATTFALAAGPARASLTRLDLEATALTSVGAAALAALPRLAALNLADCASVGDAGVADLAGVPLEPLGARASRAGHAAGVLQSPLFTRLGGGRGGAAAGGAALANVGGGARSLETLDLSWTAVTDAGLEALGRGCKRLRRLTLDGPTVTDEGVARLLAPRSAAAVWSEIEIDVVASEEGGGAEPAMVVPAPAARVRTAPLACAAAASPPSPAGGAGFPASPTSVLPSPRGPSPPGGGGGGCAPPSPSPTFARTPSTDSSTSFSIESSPPPQPPARRATTRRVRVRARGAPADLTALSLGSGCRLGERTAAALARLGPACALADLEFWGATLSDDGVAALATLRGLTRLALPRCERLTDRGLAALAAGLGGPGSVLASLDLAASSLSAAGVAASLPAFGASLEHAVLPPAALKDGGAALRAEMPRLRWIKRH